MTSTREEQTSGRRRARERMHVERRSNYRDIVNTMTWQRAMSDDEIAHIHDIALRVLEELGIKVLLPEARAAYAAGGAIVDESTQMVRIGRDIVEAALASAPKRFVANGGEPDVAVKFELGQISFVAGCGAPNVTDLDRGRRAGALADFEDIVRLVHSFDILHLHGPFVEPQDVELRFRHYATTRAQLALSTKIPFVFSRGTGQVEQSFEMIAMARGLDDASFGQGVHCYTIINTNSPRQLDVPMARGLMDFARHGQPSVVTPFCLAGAMAPISVAGALALQHAEALAGITLTQIAKPGAPVVYGSFSSNVDMKSGAPAFGTPEHVKATLGAGQLARHVGLPWRSGGGSAANISDAQAAHETQFGLWGSVLAGSTMCVHAAGWLEGGLSVSFEKMMIDIDMLQSMAEIMQKPAPAEVDAAFEAISQVEPGGHFFAAPHTMERYRTAFYQPLVSDLSNYGAWKEAGAKDATLRANAVWKSALENYRPIDRADDIGTLLDEYTARHKALGGASPEN